MGSNSKLSYAIAAILSGASLGASATANGDSGEIQEITVTAQRRTENMQDVPITIQALTGDALKELSVTTFDDFIKYLPNVTQNGFGPGQSNIYMRGLSLGTNANVGPGTGATLPNVAVYLDDQAVSFPGHNLDVYAADIERIEVLEGPQGTLFGSGAEAGVLRYITNKPKLDVTEGIVNAGYSYTAHGDPNSSADATLNLPLIADTLALRAVIYDESRGGYINNVPGTFARSGSDLGIHDFNNGLVPTNSVVINNNNTVGRAQNPVTYKGIRLSGLAKVDDDWSALLTQSYQQMDAQGVFYEMPYGSEGTTFTPAGQPIGTRPLPNLSVTTFNPAYNKDKFENTSLTVSDKLGKLKGVYSGTYLVRNLETTADYTNYARGVYGSYYQCAGLSPKSAAAGACYSPSAIWKDAEKSTHQTHEIRLSTPDEWRMRGIAGAYYEKFVITDETQWLYKTVPSCSAAVDANCFNNPGFVPDAFTTNPSIGDNTAYVWSVLRTVAQKAVFGSMDVDIIPKALTLTLGTRYYHFNEQEIGQASGSFGCKQSAPTAYFGPCLNSVINLNTDQPNSVKYTGFKSRANLSFKPTDDTLLYYTWSQGFRPGGFNLASYSVGLVDGVASFITPKVYAPDSLTNNEIGFKSLWLNRRVELNGAVYNEDWKQVQTFFFDPQSGLSTHAFTTNGPVYQVRGGELQLVLRIAEGLSVQGASSYNKSKLTNSPALINNNPASATFGTPLNIVSPYGGLGSPLADSPLHEWNIRLRDEFALSDYKAFWQIGAQHIGDSLSSTGYISAYDQPGYTTYDASVGAGRDAWGVQIFGQNLTSVNASLTTASGQFVKTETVIRPRVVGVKISYKF